MLHWRVWLTSKLQILRHAGPFSFPQKGWETLQWAFLAKDWAFYCPCATIIIYIWYALTFSALAPLQALAKSDNQQYHICVKVSIPPLRQYSLKQKIVAIMPLSDWMVSFMCWQISGAYRLSEISSAVWWHTKAFPDLISLIARSYNSWK